MIVKYSLSPGLKDGCKKSADADGLFEFLSVTVDSNGCTKLYIWRQKILVVSECYVVVNSDRLVAWFAGCLDTVEPAVLVDSLYLLVRW